MREYIEREALIARLRKVCIIENDFGLGMLFGNENAINCIKEAPTADVVEVKRGEWMKCKRIQGVKYFMCSLCSEMAKNEHNFCPNCGADMRKGVKND